MQLPSSPHDTLGYIPIPKVSWFQPVHGKLHQTKNVSTGYPGSDLMGKFLEWSKHTRPIFGGPSENPVMQRQETRTGTQKFAWCVEQFGRCIVWWLSDLHVCPTFVPEFFSLTFPENLYIHFPVHFKLFISEIYFHSGQWNYQKKDLLCTEILSNLGRQKGPCLYFCQKFFYTFHEMRQITKKIWAKTSCSPGCSFYIQFSFTFPENFFSFSLTYLETFSVSPDFSRLHKIFPDFSRNWLKLSFSPTGKGVKFPGFPDPVGTLNTSWKFSFWVPIAQKTRPGPQTLLDVLWPLVKNPTASA